MDHLYRDRTTDSVLDVKGASLGMIPDMSFDIYKFCSPVSVTTKAKQKQLYIADLFMFSNCLKIPSI